MTSLHTRIFGLLATTWGSILIYFYHSTRVKDYLDVGFHHLILVGGIGIVILGLYSIINPQEKKASCAHDHDHHDCDHDHDHAHHDHHHPDEEDGATCDHDHDEGHGPLTTILLTMIPLTLAMTYTKDDYSNTARAKKGLYEAPVLINDAPFTREDLEKRIPKNAAGEYEIRMITAYYAAGDREIQDIFDGLPVELEGRVAPEKINNDAGNRLRIFRSIITCCAADLQIVGVSMEFPESTTRPKPEDWVKAGGILTFETVNGSVLPLLKIREVTPAEEPYSEFRSRQ
jgi:uncharacterized repeat protein (TIGR03943 family)